MVACNGILDMSMAAELVQRALSWLQPHHASHIRYPDPTKSCDRSSPNSDRYDILAERSIVEVQTQITDYASFQEEKVNSG